MCGRRRVTKPTEKETFSGRLVDLLHPSPVDIDFVDIAHSLAHSTRFDGHTTTPYTIAQHSCLVANLLPPDLAIHGLLHDAHEAYLGDITVPMQLALDIRLPGARNVLNGMALQFDRLIYARAGVELPTAWERMEIKRADLTALAIEQRDLMLGENQWSNPVSAGSHPRLVALPWQRARDEYVAALSRHGVSFRHPEAA